MTVENLRSTTMFSMLQKALAIFLKKCMTPKIVTEIPPSQVAFRKGKHHCFFHQASCRKNHDVAKSHIISGNIRFIKSI